MEGSGVVQCQSPSCGMPIYLTHEEWVTLDPDTGFEASLALRCPSCGHLDDYRADSLMEVELPISHIPLKHPTTDVSA